MENLEIKLKDQLSQELLIDPSQDAENDILALIKNHQPAYMPKKSKSWLPLSIAASFLVVAAYMSTQLNFMPIKSSPKNALDLALESSKQLELSINLLDKKDISPAVFIEISRLNNQIANIDKDLQSILVENLNNTLAVQLMNKRIEKLTLVKNLYSADPDFVSI